jgi:hypothetical protein
MVMEILTLMGNLPRTVQLWPKHGKRSFVNAWVFITICKNFPLKQYFLVNLPCKMSHFWEIYHANDPLLENLP